MDRYFYPTPSSIVEKIILNEIPTKFSSVLEPAVGDGALLHAIKNHPARIVAYDISPSKISTNLRENKNLSIEFHCEDFLQAKIFGKFDLILSNPPFNNKMSDLVEFEKHRISIEAAFILRSAKLLKKNGKAIFILPSSILSGLKYRWLRRELLGNYKINSIYKLPKFSFRTVESSFFVLCFENKTQENYTISLFNEILEVQHAKKAELINGTCDLDPATISTSKSYEETIGDDFISLGEIAEITRGQVSTTGKKGRFFHTTDFNSLYARPSIQTERNEKAAKLEKNDLIIKRVGRNSSKSLSIYLSETASTFSDCVLRIRPNNPAETNPHSLLLALRSSVLLGCGKSFEMTGAGANYISSVKLRSLKLSKRLLEEAKSFQADYINAIEKMDMLYAEIIEEKLALKLTASS